MTKRLLTLGLLAGSLTLGACSDDPVSAPEPANIVETAISAGSFNTLVQALRATGLDEALAGDGPFTVFAPTDAAFAALPAGTLDALLADPQALSEILLYHVVAGDVRAADLAGRSSATTLQGGALAIATTGGVRINGANVVSADVVASNGVIHVIDQVLIPSAPEAAGFASRGTDPIAKIAIDNGFNELVGALSYVDAELNTGLVKLFLEGTEPYTVFAPTDAAFAGLYTLLGSVLGTEVDEVSDLPAEVVRDVLLYHVLKGPRPAFTVLPFPFPSWLVKRFPFLGERRIGTLLGEKFIVRADGSIGDGLTGVRPDDATIVSANIFASNGVVHVVDQVLVPASIVKLLTQ